MIGTEFLQGQGLGNRLFCYITARCLAMDKGTEFGTAGKKWLRADFLDIDMGADIEHPEDFVRYHEKEERLYLPTSAHDMVHGIYTAGADRKLLDPVNFPDNRLIEGNLQDERYFASHKGEIKRWLLVKPEYESSEYTRDDLCILNVRGGEYEGKPELFLRKKYWTDAMRRMRETVPSMKFMIVTDDEENASKLLPGIECHHFSPEKDYVTVKNARYLVISNSSFAFFPAYTSDTVRRVIAPKYWARHNVSTGYWASEQNIYDEFEYMDRNGVIFTADECRKELEKFKETGWPVTKPWKADDPDVAAIGKRNERRRLIDKAVAKIGRKLGCRVK